MASEDLMRAQVVQAKQLALRHCRVYEWGIVPENDLLNEAAAAGGRRV